MAVFLLNLSVDAPDPSPAYLPEDLSHNDQESIVEFVVEHVLGFENAFIEYDDDDNEERSSNLTLKIVLTPPAVPFSERPALVIVDSQSSPYPPYLRWPSDPSGEVPAPPPKA